MRSILRHSFQDVKWGLPQKGLIALANLELLYNQVKISHHLGQHQTQFNQPQITFVPGRK